MVAYGDTIVYGEHGVGAKTLRALLRNLREHGRSLVRLVTALVNRESVAFHVHMGFQIEPQDAEMDRIPVYRDYDVIGNDRVLFVKRL
jgi:GNAT superfamily N-acetyltransferase